MTLSAEQREFFEEVGNHLPFKPTEGQTVEQQRNMAVLGFQAACQFLGIPVPSEEEIRAELEDGRATRRA